MVTMISLEDSHRVHRAIVPIVMKSVATGAA
jgi:hypothetical protein